jgi:hypothetical protein
LSSFVSARFGEESIEGVLLGLSLVTIVGVTITATN